MFLTFFLYLLSISHSYFYKKNLNKKNKILENYAILNDFINPKKSFLIRNKKKLKNKNNEFYLTKNEECKQYHILTRYESSLNWYLKEYKVFIDNHIKFNVYIVLYSEIEYTLRQAFIEKYKIKNNHSHDRWMMILKNKKRNYNPNLSFRKNVKLLLINNLLKYEFSYVEKKRIFETNNLITFGFDFLDFYKIKKK